MDQLKELIKQQHRDLNDLASEFQRKDITPARILRLMKLVQRNVEISERIVSMLERVSSATPDGAGSGKDLTSLPKAGG